MKHLIYLGLLKNKNDVLFTVVDKEDEEKVRAKYKFLELFTKKGILFKTEGFLEYLKKCDARSTEGQ